MNSVPVVAPSVQPIASIPEGRQPTGSDALSGEPQSTSDAMRSGYQWVSSATPLGSVSIRSLGTPAGTRGN
jgi:hypothetical protein